MSRWIQIQPIIEEPGVGMGIVMGMAMFIFWIFCMPDDGPADVAMATALPTGTDALPVVEEEDEDGADRTLVNGWSIHWMRACSPHWCAA